ncbi:MAG: FtsX-like permease family protein [Bacteroidota bacterium]
MLRNQILIAVRHWFRNRGDTLIKVASLTLGITGCLLILLFVQHERSYDNFHTNNIHRVYYHHLSPSQDWKGVLTPIPLAHFIRDNLPEVQQIVRIRKDKGAVVQKGDQLIQEPIIFADTNFFSLFNFPLQAGNPKDALWSPYSVVLTPQSAEKYFGTQDVLGKILSIRLPEDSVFSDFSVSGVTERIPTNTTLPFGVLLSMQWRHHKELRSEKGTWRGSSSITYAALDQHSSPTKVQEKLNHQLQVDVGEETKNTTYLFQPITDVHGGESMYGEIVPPINFKYLLIASVVAFLLLIIAAINFTTLTLGRSVNRSREVGVRKTLGASRRQLIQQFLGESLLLTLAIAILSLGLAYLLIPYFSQLLLKPIEISLTDPNILILLASTVLVAGITAGFYPAWVLSSLSATGVLKGQTIVSQKHRIIGALVVLQFVGTVVLLVGSSSMHQQLSLLQNKELGFEESHVIRLEVPSRGSNKLFQQFRTRFASVPEVHSLTASWQLFSHEAVGIGFQILPWEVEGQEVQAYEMGVGPDFLETTQIELVQGRSFSDWSENMPKQLIVNESFVAMMGWDHPIGKRFGHEFIFKESEIIGVVKDFHFLSLHQPIGPLIIHPMNYYSNIYVRVASREIPNTLNKLKQEWKTVAPDIPFNYHFTDEDIARQYETEQRWANVITYTSLLVIFIACLGLFGMASLLTQQRTKEIGIRKVLGASVTNLLVLLSKDYLRLLVVALLIAIPIANYFIREWLNSFAYRVSVHWWIYVLVSIGVLIIALLTISGQTLKAATRNPVDSLRYE